MREEINTTEPKKYTQRCSKVLAMQNHQCGLPGPIHVVVRYQDRLGPRRPLHCFHSAYDSLQSAPPAIVPKQVHLVNEHEFHGSEEEHVLRPPPSDAIPLLWRGQYHMRARHVSEYFGTAVAGNQPDLDLRVDVSEPSGPVVVTLLTKGLAGADVHNPPLFSGTGSRGTASKVRRQQPSHGHLKDGRLAGSSGGRHYHIVFRVDKDAGHLRLEVVEGVKLAPPHVGYGGSKHLCHRERPARADGAVPGRQVVHDRIRASPVWRRLVEGRMDKRATVPVFSAWVLLLRRA